MKKLAALAGLAFLLAGCREVRVRTYTQGTTAAVGGDEVRIVRNRHDLETFKIRAPVRFNHEFGVFADGAPSRFGLAASHRVDPG